MIHNTSLTGKNTTEDPRQQHIPSLILEGLKTCVQTADTFVGCRMVAKACSSDWIICENVMNPDKVKEGAVYPNCFWCSLSYLVWPRVLALGVALPKMDLKRKAFISEIRSTSHEVYTQAALRLDKRPYMA